MGRAASVLMLLAFEAFALVVLRRLGSLRIMRVEWSDLNGWLTETPPEDALLAIARLVALGVAYWLAATTVVYALGTLAGIPAIVRGVEWATIRPVRRLVDGIVAGSIVVGSSIAGPVVAAADASRPALIPVETHAYTPVPAGDGHEPVYTPTPAGDAPTTTITPSGPPHAPTADHPGGGESGLATHLVAPGDNLWDIAELRLAQATGHPIGALQVGEIHAYWLRLIEDNRDRLRSGDPDLIFPGERLVLPSIDE